MRARIARPTRRTVAAGLVATAMAAPASGAAGTRDLMPAFFAAYDRAGTGALEARARVILETFFQPHIDAYRGAALGRVDLARYLAVLDPMAADVRRLSAGFAAIWQDQIARFRAALPDFSADLPLTVLPSFLQFDAKTRLWQGRVHLFFGLDGVVWMHGADGNLPVLIAHECFHLYQHQVNPSLLFPSGDPVWLGVWMEGLAVFASRQLNPQASRLQVLLDDRELAAASEEVVRRVAGELPAQLDQTDGRVRARYLSFGYRGDIPARSAYLVGLAIAERAAATRSLAELARLPAAEARTLVLAELNALAGR